MDEPVAVGLMFCLVGIIGFGFDLRPMITDGQTPMLLPAIASAAILAFGVAHIAAWWRLRQPQRARHDATGRVHF